MLSISLLTNALRDEGEKKNISFWQHPHPPPLLLRRGFFFDVAFIFVHVKDDAFFAIYGIFIGVNIKKVFEYLPRVDVLYSS